MRHIRKRLTYANVMSSIAVFLLLGGAAVAASQLPKKSVGTSQLKANAVTTAKIKKEAVTKKKIKNAAVDGSKVQDGSLTGADINLSTLGTVPNSATTNVIKASKGTFSVGQQVTAFEYGPIKVVVRCEIYELTELTAHAYIESSTPGTTFTSWRDGSKELGPATPEAERELNAAYWVNSAGPYTYDSASDVGVSATAASGQSFTAFIALASEKNTSTCWYWSTATIIS